MTHENFCVWLDGFLDLSEATYINEKQLDVIKEHLNLALCSKLNPQPSPQVRTKRGLPHYC